VGGKKQKHASPPQKETFLPNLSVPTYFNLSNPTGYFTCHQVEHSKILHGDYIAFMCFVCASEQTVRFSLYIIDRLVFINEVESVYSAVRTESYYKDTSRPQLVKRVHQEITAGTAKTEKLILHYLSVAGMSIPYYKILLARGVVKVSSLRAMKAYRENRVTAPLILTLGTR
jgi:hypothetical protein